ncbi:MAG TPA: HU family DNA-binding protein [Chthoniobacteraceae bacterium]|nr:HU family DNA-binding protein [Chthoniobacteraceae bacterium]
MAAKSLTKAEFVDELASTLTVSKRDANNFLDALLAIAYRETKKKGEFVLPGIGKLVKQKRKARKGVNPKTGEAIRIAASTVIKLRVAKAAKDAILGTAKKAAPAEKPAPAARKKAPAKAAAKAAAPAAPAKAKRGSKAKA